MSTHHHLPHAEIHDVPSRHVPQTFRLSLVLPREYSPDGRPLPLVCATDANLYFHALAALALGFEHRFILAGIGYPSDHPRAGIRLRARDFTFPGYPEIDVSLPKGDGVLLEPADCRCYGGADAFQCFLGDECLPLLRTRYAIDPGTCIYFGHSAGAGFGLYTALTRPRMFSGYILSSPGLAYDGSVPGGRDYRDHQFARHLVKAAGRSGVTLPDTKLYISVGSEEDEDPGLENWRLTSTVRDFGAHLARSPLKDADVHVEILAGEHHGTAWASAFCRGIRHILGQASRSDDV